jgi:LTXXQ motif family protein
MMQSAPMRSVAPMSRSVAPMSRSVVVQGARGVSPKIYSPGVTSRRMTTTTSRSRHVTISGSSGIKTGKGSLTGKQITGTHITGKQITGKQITGKQITGTQLTGKQSNQNLVRRSLGKTGHAEMIRNKSLASLSTRHAKTYALAHSTFQGKLKGSKWEHHDGHHDGWHWRHHHPISVIGWAGPLFWPYAYDDFLDYTYWPYAYDAFWPYAYDDLYVGVFGPYAYEDPVYLPATRGARSTPRRPLAVTQVCGERVPALTDWPVQQIAEAVQPDDAQRAALDDLKAAAAKAIDALQSACPGDLPNTPTGRLSAMRQRIEAMTQAVALVRPPLEKFYGLLSDEQKARFNATTPATEPPRSAAAGSKTSDLAEVCSGATAKASPAPTARIRTALRPTDAQGAALDALDEASAKASDLLKAKCPEDQALTPPGRVAAMQQRLDAMLQALQIVQPALEAFYGTLSDEQKARFNQLGPRRG